MASVDETSRKVGGGSLKRGKQQCCHECSEGSQQQDSTTATIEDEEKQEQRKELTAEKVQPHRLVIGVCTGDVEDDEYMDRQQKRTSKNGSPRGQPQSPAAVRSPSKSPSSKEPQQLLQPFSIQLDTSPKVSTASMGNTVPECGSEKNEGEFDGERPVEDLRATNSEG